MDKITEESILFVSVLKWFLLASAVGILVGLSATGFLKLLDEFSGALGQVPYYFLFLPLALCLSAVLIRRLATDAAGMGTDKVIEAVHNHSGKIRTAVVPVKLVATIVTIAAGGSAGKIGPCAQIGGGLTSLLADRLRFDETDRKKLVICGISAGFAAVFGTPIAGAVFGVEVLFVGAILYEVLLPSLVAGVIAHQVASALGITYFHHSIHLTPVFSRLVLIEAALAGILFGLISFLLIEVLRISRILAEKTMLGPAWKGIVGGTVLVGLALLFSQDYLGLGIKTIQNCLDGKSVHPYSFFLKMIFTGITLSFGGSGGIIVPILFVGSTSGVLLGEIFGIDTATFAAIGFVAVLAGATNTPIAATLLALELFGPQIGAYAAVACAVSFLMTGYRSVFPSQILAVRKSASLQVEIGKGLDQVRPQVHMRDKSLIGIGSRIFNRLVGKEK